jgi:hypothetical protein
VTRLDVVMPRDGSMIPSDVRGPTLTIVCERRGRYGRYSVKRLIAAHGTDVSLPDVLATLPNCLSMTTIALVRDESI